MGLRRWPQQPAGDKDTHHPHPVLFLPQSAASSNGIQGRRVSEQDRDVKGEITLETTAQPRDLLTSLCGW